MKKLISLLLIMTLCLSFTAFATDSDMDFCINENEVEFVKERVSISELIDLSKKAIESPEPVLEEQPKTESKPKGVKNERQKSNSASKAKLQTRV